MWLVTFTRVTGTVNYAEPVATLALPTSVQGVAINPETQTAIFADPSSGGVISFFSLIDQSVSNPLTNRIADERRSRSRGRRV